MWHQYKQQENCANIYVGENGLIYHDSENNVTKGSWPVRVPFTKNVMDVTNPWFCSANL